MVIVSPHIEEVLILQGLYSSERFSRWYTSYDWLPVTVNSSIVIFVICVSTLVGPVEQINSWPVNPAP